MLIFLSTLRLIIDTFVESSYITDLVFDIADIIFNICFYIECILKIIGEGFIVEEGTYLRDNWNKLDFLIVVVSMVDMKSIIDNFEGVAVSTGVPFFRVLRLLRTLRPLRFISHNVQLKLIVRSLLDSILPILNVLFIVLVIFLMYGIAGITVFYSSYHTCYQTSEIYGYPLAFENFADLLHNAGYSGVNDAENKFFVN